MDSRAIQYKVKGSGDDGNESDGSDNSDGSNRTEDSKMSGGGPSEQKNVIPSIIEAIQDSQLKHLFVFISHPDSDHYNKLLDIIGAFPDIKITVFLGGDWLGITPESQEQEGAKESAVGENSIEGAMSERIQFIKNLGEMSNVWIELPYYWNYKNNDEHQKIQNYDDILKSFSSSGMSKVGVAKDEEYNQFKYKEFPNNKPKIFQGNLLRLLDEIYNRVHASENKHNERLEGKRSVIVKQNFATFRERFEDLLLTERRSILENIMIWLMNQRFDDVNSQSTIVSFIMPELKINVTCTGDARDEVFNHSWFDRLSQDMPEIKYSSNQLNTSSRYEEFKAKLKDIQKTHLNVLIIPHHGSRNNISRRVLELFHPDLFIISAGNGVKEHHPDKATINAYKRAVRLNSGLVRNNFFNYYNQINPEQISGISYSIIKKLKKLLNAQGKKEYEKILINHLFKFSRHNPILSTNILGNLEFNSEGIKSDFSNIIRAEDTGMRERDYRVDFRKRVEDIVTISALEDLMKLNHTEVLASAVSALTEDEGWEEESSSRKRVKTRHLRKSKIIQHDDNFYFPVKQLVEKKSNRKRNPSAAVSENSIYSYYPAYFVGLFDEVLPSTSGIESTESAKAQNIEEFMDDGMAAANEDEDDDDDEGSMIIQEAAAGAGRGSSGEDDDWNGKSDMEEEDA